MNAARDPITIAIALLGRQKIAESCGVKPNSVTQWKMSGHKVPAHQCKIIERLTDGMVTAEQLRPDVFSHEKDES